MKGVSVCSRAPTSSVWMCVCWWGFWRRRCERTHSESWCSKLTCWFLLGLWWSCDSRLKHGMIPPLQCVCVSWLIKIYIHTGFVDLGLSEFDAPPSPFMLTMLVCFHTFYFGFALGVHILTNVFHQELNLVSTRNNWECYRSGHCQESYILKQYNLFKKQNKTNNKSHTFLTLQERSTNISWSCWFLCSYTSDIFHISSFVGQNATVSCGKRIAFCTQAIPELTNVNQRNPPPRLTLSALLLQKAFILKHFLAN